MIQLVKMTKPLLYEFFSKFAPDPATFTGKMPEQTCDCEYIDKFFKKHDKPDRVHFAIINDDEVVGDLYLKHIDLNRRCCTLSIHMANDRYKNRGFGTQAELLALEYAFQILHVEKVFADALITNTISCHVLQKVGFTEIGRDQEMCYFCCCRSKS